ncbi:hypothetical protein EVAR_61782_1 [Eumeta japonica]|uniref:Uncharacterized protein n=1 Tax=Eumeta variegata TaxID=151549 RepID=A0A4C1Z2X8_EUMVA|nr:hypothetical protein EVAR_61782_1 [Eumeta japonica]
MALRTKRNHVNLLVISQHRRTFAKTRLGRGLGEQLPDRPAAELAPYLATNEFQQLPPFKTHSLLYPILFHEADNVFVTPPRLRLFRGIRHNLLSVKISHNRRNNSQPQELTEDGQVALQLRALNYFTHSKLHYPIRKPKSVSRSDIALKAEPGPDPAVAQELRSRTEAEQF